MCVPMCMVCNNNNSVLFKTPKALYILSVCGGGI